MIYTLGPEGTFSEKAASLLASRQPGKPTLALLPDISSVFERIVQEENAIGVVPIENSVVGTVHVVQDLLLRHPVWIGYEIHVPVAYKLLVRGERQQVRRVFVHPVAERQCAASLRQQVPGATPVFTDSNADSAVRLLAEQEDAAAVVPVDYRRPHDVQFSSLLLETPSHNTTRFVAIRRLPEAPQPDFDQEKLSMIITPHVNRPGLLHDILGAFHRNGMNLTRIESRPAGEAWQYLFFLDARITPATSRAWSELQQGDWDVRLLGCYSVIQAP